MVNSQTHTQGHTHTQHTHTHNTHNTHTGTQHTGTHIGTHTHTHTTHTHAHTHTHHKLPGLNFKTSSTWAMAYIIFLSGHFVDYNI